MNISFFQCNNCIIKEACEDRGILVEREQLKSTVRSASSRSLLWREVSSRMF